MPGVQLLHPPRPFEVDGQEVGADRAMLTTPTEPIVRPALSEEEKRRFLRERGLFLADGSFDLYESIVEANEACEVHWPAAPEGAPPFVLGLAGKTRARHPYRG